MTEVHEAEQNWRGKSACMLQETCVVSPLEYKYGMIFVLILYLFWALFVVYEVQPDNKYKYFVWLR